MEIKRCSTEAAIKKLKPRSAPYPDRDGLYLRVGKNRKTWLFLYRNIRGKKKFHRLGEYTEKLDLKAARGELIRAKEMLLRGEDPAEEKTRVKTEQITAPTVADVAEIYLERWAKPNKRTWREDQRMLKKDVIPAIGNRKAKDVTRIEIINILENIATRREGGARVTPNRTLALIRKMFNFACERGILEHSPCAGIKPLAKEKSKSRFLNAEEIKTFWQALDSASMSDEIKRALKLILGTAQRPGEVISMQLSEIEGQWWTIPANKTKNGKEHRVYLSSLALELIGEPYQDSVFPSPKEGQSIHINALGHAIRRNRTEGKRVLANIDDFTPHDLRRTAATHMAERGFAAVVPKILNHTDRTVTAVYNRYSFDKEKQTALEAWSRELKRITGESEEAKILSFSNGGKK